MEFGVSFLGTGFADSCEGRGGEACRCRADLFGSLVPGVAVVDESKLLAGGNDKRGGELLAVVGDGLVESLDIFGTAVAPFDLGDGIGP